MSEPETEQLARTYDRWYQQEDAAHWEDAPGKAVLMAALPRCLDPDRPLRLLDIGCGTGSFLERIRRQVSEHWELHGIDLSQVAVEAGRERFPELHLTAGDATRLEYPDGSFDAVTCYGSWEHFPQPDQAIAEAGRLLAPGGWVLAMIPALGIHRTDRDDEGWYEDTEVPGHDHRQLQWNYTRESWSRMFSSAGLQLVDGDLAAGCGARKPGVFFFGVKLRSEEAVSGDDTARSFLALSQLAGQLPAAVGGAVGEAAELMAESLRGGGKILACGNGGSAADAQHFVAELVGRLRRERRSLPALSLTVDPSVMTAVSNDYGYDQVFARQVEGLGDTGDVLLLISTSGRSPNLLQAANAARRHGLRTVALLGRDRRPELDGCDISIHIPCADGQRVQEAHTAVLHAVCAELERRLLPVDEAAAGSPSL